MLRQAVKRLVLRAFDAVGYDANPQYLRDTLPLRDHLQALFDLYRVGCVVDVGGHWGEYGSFLRKHVGYRGRIVSFEPVTENYARLVSECERDPAWIAVQMALGSRAGMQAINVTKSTTFSSFLTPSEAGMNKIRRERFRDSATVDYQEEVRLGRLDDLWDEYVVKTAGSGVYLKMDTQGYDSEVLAGAGTRLSDIAALQTEVSVLRLYEGGVDFLDAIHALNDRGFQVSGMFPVVRDDALCVVEFDCVMVRPEKLAQ